MLTGCASGELEEEARFSALLDFADRIDGFHLEPKTLQYYSSTCQQYEAFCLCLRSRREAWPATAQMVRLFLIFKFFKNKMSAKSLPAYLTHVKWSQEKRGHEWFIGSALKQIRVTVGALRKVAAPEHKVIRRKTPLTIVRIRLMLASLLPSENASHLELVTLCWLCHNGLLRGGEAVRLLLRDIVWSADRRSFMLVIRDSKCNKTGPPEMMQLFDWESDSSSVTWMREYYDRKNLWASSPDTPLFPAYVVKSKFVAAVQALVDSAGLTGDFAGHSFRSGGAADLWAANVPVEAIKKIGRWKSDAVMLYLRDGEVTAKKVALAFEFCSVHDFFFWDPKSGA